MTTFLSVIMGDGLCAGLISFGLTSCVVGGLGCLMFRIAAARYRSDKVWYATSSSVERIEQHISAMRPRRSAVRFEALKQEIEECDREIRRLRRLVAGKK